MGRKDWMASFEYSKVAGGICLKGMTLRVHTLGHCQVIEVYHVLHRIEILSYELWHKYSAHPIDRTRLSGSLLTSVEQPPVASRDR